MRRSLLSLRHAVTVAAGASIIWLTQEAALALLGLVPGYSEQITEWFSIHPPAPASTAFVLSLLLAAIVSWIQEAPRTRGLFASVWLGVIFGLVTFDSRISSTPAHLRDVAASFAALRAVGVISATVLMYIAKKRWLRHDESVVSNAG